MKQEIKIKFKGQNFTIMGMLKGYVKALLAQDSNGILYFINGLKGVYSFQVEPYNLSLFIGKAGEIMKQGKILEIAYYEDGGTIEIEFELEGRRGMLYFPHKLSDYQIEKEKREKPTVTYKGQRPIKLERLYPDEKNWVWNKSKNWEDRRKNE